MESIFKYFLLLLLATSCVGQGMDLKDKSSHISQATEIQRGEETKRAPSGMQGLRNRGNPGQVIQSLRDSMSRPRRGFAAKNKGNSYTILKQKIQQFFHANDPGIV